MRNYMLSILIILITLPNLFCSEINEQKQVINSREIIAVEEINQLDPLVEVEVLPYLEFDERLVFNLRIKNCGNEPIYFYSALLDNPKILDIYVDSEEKIIETRFTRFHTFASSPNDFPDAEFTKVEPKEAYQREFTTEISFKKKAYYDSDAGYKLQRIDSGTWRIRVAVAYGYEIDSVQRKIAEIILIGKEHPINPIVEWQKIAYSNYGTIVIQK